jgi:hypothetical protein
MKFTPEEHIERLEQRKQFRSTFENHWQELADHILPEHNNIRNRQTAGTKKGITLFDNTAAISCEMLAGALHGMLTNPASQWFGLTMGDRALDVRDDVRLWLEDCADKMLVIMNSSNFQPEVHSLYMQEIAFGGAAMFIEEDKERVICFSTKPVQTVFLDENARGQVDVVDYLTEMTAKQIVQRYGQGNTERAALEPIVGKKVASAFEKKSADKFEVLHSTYPRDMTDPYVLSSKTSKGFPLAADHTLVCEKKNLESGGYNESPWVTPRWMVVPGEIYGRGPGMKVLPDTKMINEMTKTMLEGAQKVVNPPVSVPDDGFILPLKLKANGVNFRRSGGSQEDRIEPIFNDTRIDFGHQILDDTRRRIREGFYVDQLQLPWGGPQMTATETNVRQEDKLRIMGPMLGRQQVEFLDPLIRRIFGIMFRKKMFLEAPAVIRGKRAMVRYTSPIARAQKVADGQNILRGLQMLAPIQALHPEVMDNFDADAAALFIATDVSGFPQRIIRKATERDALRKGRQEAQAQQAQSAQAQQQAAIAEQGSKAVLNVSQANQAGGQLPNAAK